MTENNLGQESFLEAQRFEPEVKCRTAKPPRSFTLGSFANANDKFTATTNGEFMNISQEDRNRMSIKARRDLEYVESVIALFKLIFGWIKSKWF